MHPVHEPNAGDPAPPAEEGRMEGVLVVVLLETGHDHPDVPHVVRGVCFLQAEEERAPARVHVDQEPARLPLGHQPAAQFVNDLLPSIPTHRMAEFRERQPNNDALLGDHVQLLAGKVPNQNHIQRAEGHIQHRKQHGRQPEAQQRSGH